MGRHKRDKRVLIWPEWGKKAALREGYSDFLDPTAWVVSGGGGGVTSEHVPLANGSDDQYGFMDMTLSKKLLSRAGARGALLLGMSCLCRALGRALVHHRWVSGTRWRSHLLRR